MMKDVEPPLMVIVSKEFSLFRFEMYEKVRQELGGNVEVLSQVNKSGTQGWTILPEKVFCGRIRYTGRGLKGYWLMAKTILARPPRYLWVMESSLYSVVALILGKVSKSKIILATEVGSDSPKYARQWYSGFWQPVWRFLSDGIVAYTKEAERTALRIGKPCCFAPHAISSREYTPSPLRESDEQKTFQFLYVGRIIPHKGVKDLVEAGMRLEKHTDTPFHLRLVGGGILQEWLTAQSAEHEWLEYTSFLQKAELIKAYQKADVFVFPSYQDTYAVVIHEACCCGLPLIVSKETGASEVLANSDNSILFHAGDLDALCAAMQQLLENPKQLAGMKEESRRLGEQHTSEVLAKSCAAWIRTLGE